MHVHGEARVFLCVLVRIWQASDADMAPQKPYGVELLWRAVSAPAGLHEDVVAVADKSFIDMITGRSELVCMGTCVVVAALNDTAAGNPPGLRTLGGCSFRTPARRASVLPAKCPYLEVTF